METATAYSAPPSPLRGILTLLLALSAPPLALVAWILLSGGERPAYLRSPWVRLGAGLVLLGALPLLVVVVAAAIGLWPDPNPNPIGLGLLFLAAGALGCVLALIGTLLVAFRHKSA